MVNHSRMTIVELRRIWIARQGLGKRPPKGILDLPWLYSAGSAIAYLSVRARLPKLSREQMERAGLMDVPALRGNMLVPPADLGLALAAGRRSNAERFGRLAAKCKVTAKEVQDLCAAVVDVLSGGPLPMDQIRERIPPKLIRNFGEEGRLLGETSSLPVALRDLQAQGRVLRIPENLRWDDNRYVYRLSKPPKQIVDKKVNHELARRFFHWAGPATLAEFAFWANLGKKEAEAAIKGLKLERLEVEGWSNEAYQEPGATKPETSGVILLPFRDNYLYFRRNMTVFLDPAHRQVRTLDIKNQLRPLVMQPMLHHHAILFDGRLVGAWEYDPERKEIAWTLWEEVRGVEQAIEEMAEYIRTELGDLRFYAFDAGKGRRMRIESLR